MKNLYIAEKPSVARQFADVLGVKGNAGNGYLESDTAVVTWCVGHLVTMSYPEVYDPNLKKWSLSTIHLFQLNTNMKFFLTQRNSSISLRDCLPAMT